MRALTKRFIVVGLAVAVGMMPATGNAMSDFGRKRLASVCTALLAIGTVGMAGVAQYSGQQQDRGFSARVIGSNRRAIVAFLAKALGLKSNDGGAYRFETKIEAEGFDPDSFGDWSAEDLDDATVITEEADGYARGFVVVDGKRIQFKMKRTMSGRYKFTAL